MTWPNLRFGGSPADGRYEYFSAVNSCVESRAAIVELQGVYFADSITNFILSKDGGTVDAREAIGLCQSTISRKFPTSPQVFTYRGRPVLSYRITALRSVCIRGHFHG